MGDDSLTWEPVVESISQIITLQAADLDVVNIVVNVLWHAALTVLYTSPSTILLQDDMKKILVAVLQHIIFFNSNHTKMVCLRK